MEIQLLDFIHQYMANPFFDMIFVFCTDISEHGEIWIVSAIVMLFFKRYRTTGILLFVVLVTAFLGSEVILKNVICRSRPFCVNTDIGLIIPSPTGYSFPSSHSAVSFAAATVIFYYHKKIGILAFILAALIAFSRLYLYVHYVTDVLGGICIGLFCAFITIFVYKHNLSS